MNRGVERRAVFDNASHGRRFVDLLSGAVQQCDLTLHAYCLMPNHFHLLMRASTSELSRCMQLVGTNYTRYYNWSTERDGPLFRARFHCKPVGTTQYVTGVSRYIHRNPVGRVVPSRLHEYRWSSMRHYAHPASAPPWLSLEPILSEVGGSEAYRRLVSRDDSELQVDVSWAISVAIATADLPTRNQGRGLDRSLACLLARGSDPDVERQICEWLGLQPDELDVHAAKAENRLARHPEVQPIIDHLHRIFRPTPQQHAPPKLAS